MSCRGTDRRSHVTRPLTGGPSIAGQGSCRQSAASMAEARACDRVTSPSMTSSLVWLETRSRNVPCAGLACTASKIFRAGGDRFATHGLTAATGGGAGAEGGGGGAVHAARPRTPALAKIPTTTGMRFTRSPCSLRQAATPAGCVRYQGLAQRTVWQRPAVTVSVMSAGQATDSSRTAPGFPRTGSGRCLSSPGTRRPESSMPWPLTSPPCRNNHIRRSA
jgi:hypothetical protein